MLCPVFSLCKHFVNIITHHLYCLISTLTKLPGFHALCKIESLVFNEHLKLLPPKLSLINLYTLQKQMDHISVSGYQLPLSLLCSYDFARVMNAKIRNTNHSSDENSRKFTFVLLANIMVPP